MASSKIPALDTDDAESTAFENTSSLKRSPTASSYYDFDQVPWDGGQGQSWMYAEQARVQQDGLRFSSTRSSVLRAKKGVIQPKYPSVFWNKEKFSLSAKCQLIYNSKERRRIEGWLHHPLIPGRTETFKGECKPGLVRSIFNPRNPYKFDVVVHIETEKSNNGFKMATYHPAVKQVDKIGVVVESSNEN